MADDRFVRWQSNTIAQLSTALTLFSGLSVGGLGFMLSLLRDASFVPVGCYRVAFLASLSGFFIAAAAGVGAVITRLLDFRLTAQKVRNGETEEPLTIFGKDASGYGRATWGLLWTLVISFSVGVLLASVVIVSVYLKRVF